MNSITRTLTLGPPHGRLTGHLSRPDGTRTLIIVAHAGLHHDHPLVAPTLATRHHALLAVDLFNRHEEHSHDPHQNAAQLALRLLHFLDFARNDGDTADLALALYASGAAAPAAVRAGAQRDADVHAIVTYGGLIDHAGIQYLEALAAPLLTLVERHDRATELATRRAFQHLRATHELHLIDPADAAAEAAAWFGLWLR